MIVNYLLNISCSDADNVGSPLVDSISDSVVELFDSIFVHRLLVLKVWEWNLLNNTDYNFSLSSADAPIDINQLFTEQLREKIREESRLVNDNNTPDIEFSGSVINYNIRYVAPDENNTTSLNRLEIGVRVNYSSNIDPEDNWSKNYTDFEDFDSNADFQSLQDNLIALIIEDIVERIFNDSFTNW